MIDAEDAAQPLSDLKLMRRLAERGVRVARRTVTKYRDGMGIAPWQARQLARARTLRSGPVPIRD
jgi:RNA polymerase sigma-54 factor